MTATVNKPIKVFATEYEGPDGRYGDSVAALSWEAAQALVDQRGRNERVIGTLVAIVPCDGGTDPNALLAALSDRGDSTVH